VWIVVVWHWPMIVAEDDDFQFVMPNSQLPQLPNQWILNNMNELLYATEN
jgi:hypothetical protein